MKKIPLEQKVKVAFEDFPFLKDMQDAIDRQSTAEDKKIAKELYSKDYTAIEDYQEPYERNDIVAEELIKSFSMVFDDVEEGEAWIMLQFIVETLGDFYNFYAIMNDIELSKAAKYQCGMWQLVEAENNVGVI